MHLQGGSRFCAAGVATRTRVGEGRLASAPQPVRANSGHAFQNTHAESARNVAKRNVVHDFEHLALPLCARRRYSSCRCSPARCLCRLCLSRNAIAFPLARHDVCSHSTNSVSGKCCCCEEACHSHFVQSIENRAHGAHGERHVSALLCHHTTLRKAAHGIIADA